MANIQDMRIVKPPSQNIIEAVESIIAIAVMYYIIVPSKKDKHIAFCRKQVERVKFWVSVQATIASIHGLPETGNSCNT